MALKKHNPTLADLPSARVVTVGDVIHDIWIHGIVDRISPEAPVPVFLEKFQTTAQGGAGNVVANLAALGIKDDANVLVGNGRWHPPIKRRFVVGNQQIFRHDVEETTPMTDAAVDAAYKLATASASIGCLILSDYGKGTLTPALCQRLIRWARMFNIPVVVDPKGDNWGKYDGATVITPNENEAREAGLWGKADVLKTCGERGMEYWPVGASMVPIPAQAREVFDVTGAGDTVVAVLAAALAVGFEMEPAARLANAAAGVVVGKRGTAVCSLDELRAVIDPEIRFENGSSVTFSPGEPFAGSGDGFTILEGEAEAACIASVRVLIADMKPAGDINRWQNQWSDNLAAYRKSGDPADLRPRYIRKRQPVRLDGKFVVPDDHDYEWHWYQRFFPEFARRWLDGFDSIHEFGCGSGHNVAVLAQMIPRSDVYGLDWAQASIEICQEMRKNGLQVFGSRFDFFNPNHSHVLGGRAAVLTVGALEQTGILWRPFLDYLLLAKPARVVHLEPILDWYDPENPVDNTAIEAHEKRGFFTGYLGTLSNLHHEGKIRIEHTKRTGFGSLMIEGYSQIVWRPV